jgi:hypothetical protein
MWEKSKDFECSLGGNRIYVCHINVHILQFILNVADYWKYPVYKMFQIHFGPDFVTMMYWPK